MCAHAAVVGIEVHTGRSGEIVGGDGWLLIPKKTGGVGGSVCVGKLCCGCVCFVCVCCGRGSV